MSGAWVWRAIAVGAAIAIGVSVGLTAFGLFAGTLMNTLDVVVVMWGMRLAGLAGDCAGGFVAGRIAGRDGFLHGAVVGAISATAGVGFALLAWFSSGIEFLPEYFVSFALWTVVGWVLAAAGGLLGAQSRRSAAS